MSQNRPYIFHELTNSICSTCYRKLEAKVIAEDSNVYLYKVCPDHGAQKVLISEDYIYYKNQRTYIKPGQIPESFFTKEKNGCPYDCGICPGHEQHACVSIVELTDRCNLSCPVCYADSSPERKSERSLQQIKTMLDRIVEAEGEPDVVQISGGEPTIHEEFFEVLDHAQSLPIKHLMINTNGLKIASDLNFVKKLKTYAPGFEVYLQFDSLKPEPYQKLRGKDLLKTKLKALEHLNEVNLSTTLVMVVADGLNIDEIGPILEFAKNQRCVRGVTFQPIQLAGRYPSKTKSEQKRMTLSKIRNEILKQSDIFKQEDLIPVPCNPDHLAMAYAVKEEGGTLLPLSGMIDKDALLNSEQNTIVFEKDPEVHKYFLKTFSTGNSPEMATELLDQLLCCLPLASSKPALSYDSLFRILIVEFMDAENFDVRSIKRSCIQIAHPDGRLIPFETYNLFYRPGLEERIAPYVQK